MNTPVIKGWLCPICGYEHIGPEPPDECPICGAEKEVFEPIYMETEEITTELVPGNVVEGSDGGLRIIIAGAGIAGVTAAEAVRKNMPHAEIILLSEESNLPYYRINLTRYLAGDVTVSQLQLHPEEWYGRNNIQLLKSVHIAAIDPGMKEISLNDARKLAYDRLILAVGSHPFVPPLAGADLKNVRTLRTLTDADEILALCQAGTSCVCIGGGLLGLETAGALARRGVKVTVIENMDWLLPRQLNEAAAGRFQSFVEKLGITVRVKTKVKEIQGGDSVKGVFLESGEFLPADMVVFSAGVRSNLELARMSGINVNLGIVVDDHMQTSTVDVFAAGDVAEHNGILYGVWAPSQAQGSVAGLNAAGKKEVFQPGPRTNTIKVLGINMYSIGKITASDGDQVIEGEVDGTYYVFVFTGNLLVGAILLGDESCSAYLKKLIEHKQDCSRWLQEKFSVEQILNALD